MSLFLVLRLYQLRLPVPSPLPNQRPGVLYPDSKLSNIYISVPRVQLICLGQIGKLPTLWIVITFVMHHDILVMAVASYFTRLLHSETYVTATARIRLRVREPL